jgi:hypothetical protein
LVTSLRRSGLYLVATAAGAEHAFDVADSFQQAGSLGQGDTHVAAGVFGRARYSLAAGRCRYAGAQRVVQGLVPAVQQTATIGSARLHVCSHGKKRFVIALKYEGEEEYRYIVATDLSWRTLDIVEAYTLRWLIEVFFEDWKICEGWGRLTKHTGEKGSRRGVIVSLLVDHCLLFHPDQQAFIDDNLTACTVGSLIRRIRIECFLQFVRDMIINEEKSRKLDDLAEILKNEIYRLEPSSKHMSGRKMERLEPTPSLKYKNAA